MAATAFENDVARDHLACRMSRCSRALVLIPALRRFGPSLALIAAVACLVGSGTSTFRVVASAVAIGAVVAGMVLKNRWLARRRRVVLVVVLAVTHFEVFEHQLLAGWAPAGLAANRRSRSRSRWLRPWSGSELVGGLGATTRGRAGSRRAGRSRAMSRLRRAACACAAGLALATFARRRPGVGSCRAAVQRPATGPVLDAAPQHGSR